MAQDSEDPLKAPRIDDDELAAIQGRIQGDVDGKAVDQKAAPPPPVDVDSRVASMATSTLAACRSSRPPRFTRRDVLAPLIDTAITDWH
jgi:hypothetical protein